MQIAGAIFDLDGTVIDTLPIVIQAFRKAITSFANRSFTDHEIIQLFGPSEEGVLKRALPDQWKEGLAIYQREYETLFEQMYIGPFPGIVDALTLLKQHNIATAIVTGKGAKSTTFSLRKAGLEKLFNIVKTGSPDGPVKPKGIHEILSEWRILPYNAFYLGDSPSDVRDARQVGVIPLAGVWAVLQNKEEIEAQKPVAIFNTPFEFIAWIEGSLK